MGSDPKRCAPGPVGHWLLGHLREFRRDALGLLLQSVRTWGDVVRFRLGPRIVHLLNHPDHVEHVLQRNHGNFDKNTRSSAFIRAVTGTSLLTACGQFWQRDRRMLQPSFHGQTIARFAGQITAATSAMMTSWRAHAKHGQPLDVASEMMRLTYTVAARTFFNTDPGSDAETIERAMRVILPHTWRRIGSLLNSPGWFPTRSNRRFRKALRDVDHVVYRIIAQHRRNLAAGQPDADVLALLLEARDPETGACFNDRQLRNETITFLLAGHETTANALTWTLYLVSQHPIVERDLRDEVNAVLGGRVPTVDDLPKLVLTRMVLKEAMRLYPPVWIVERRVLAPDVVGGFPVPGGSAVVIAPYALHRHPAFWERPEEFEPGRFANRVPQAYLPFGAGPRFCIGSEFALLEAPLVLAMVVQAFRLRLAPGQQVEPLPGITLRARHGLRMTLADPRWP